MSVIEEQLTTRDRALIEFVDICGLVAMRQLVARFFGQRKTARDRVLELTHRNFLMRWRQTPGAETLYSLGPLGATVLGSVVPEQMPARSLDVHLELVDVCVAFGRSPAVEVRLLAPRAHTPDAIVGVRGHAIHVLLDEVGQHPHAVAARRSALPRGGPYGNASLVVMASRRARRLHAMAAALPPGDEKTAFVRLPMVGDALGPRYAIPQTLMRVTGAVSLEPAFSIALIE